MNNSETSATFGHKTQHEEKKNTQKTKKVSYPDPTQNRIGGITHGRQFLHFYKIPAMIFIVKSCKLLLMIEERKVYLKGKKDSLPFEKLIFRNDQPFMLTAIYTSTQEQCSLVRLAFV